MKNILFIVGSPRKNSFNLQLARKAAALLEGRANFNFLDYSDVPFMNQDIEFPTPEPVARVREAFEAADVLWFVSPENNGSYTAYLKNLLDWMSRPKEKQNPAAGRASTDKKYVLSGVAGRSAAQGSLQKLEELLNYIKMQKLEVPTEGFSLNKESFTSDVLHLSPEDEERLAKQVEALLLVVNQ